MENWKEIWKTYVERLLVFPVGMSESKSRKSEMLDGKRKGKAMEPISLLEKNDCNLACRSEKKGRRENG